MSLRILLLASPPIAQLVERRTVDDTLAVTGILRSLVRIRLGGWRHVNLCPLLASRLSSIVVIKV